MQVYITLEQSYKGKTCENYAEYWCSLLKEPGGDFALCHSTVQPNDYFKKCMYDSCNCENNEDCMCAALYSYVRACASKGVMLTNWREKVCECLPPKIYLNCNATEPGSTGAECYRMCGNQNLDCYSEKCVSGCVCPEGLLDNKNGSCVIEDKCPCMHNDLPYPPGTRFMVDCNTCTCQKGSWNCTNIPCFGACTIYGSGHYITFDSKHYNFDGNCEYVAVQDFELKLAEGKHEIIQQNENKKVPFTIRILGLYLTLEANNGLILIWDKKTSVFIKLSPSYQVDPKPFYDACVHDSCSCDSGGDCECFCMAVHSYSFACKETGICINWRTPDICPMYCSFYNPAPEMCEWHYYPCGLHSFQTCLNPNRNDTFQLEGCYPKCPADKPLYDEHSKKCVDTCGCYAENGTHYDINDTVVAINNCEKW
ncbi:hypothetical protein scyTo_0017466 [Scyliorhinus torazame]|uniref:Uncharacterized protein n=1 Tax=Scyliorhinus torazame TaxID=75743 RepID=A0A401PTK8_SCYTO|nr:hypothetical protein [Scyliorhinus torazame]